MNKRLFALEVTGEAMEPEIMEGDQVWVSPDKEPRPNGKDLAVLRVNNNLHLCRFTRFGHQLMLIHDNAPIAVIKAADAKILGAVIGGTYENEESRLAENKTAFA